MGAWLHQGRRATQESGRAEQGHWQGMTARSPCSSVWAHQVRRAGQEHAEHLSMPVQCWQHGGGQSRSERHSCDQRGRESHGRTYTVVRAGHAATAGHIQLYGQGRHGCAQPTALGRLLPAALHRITQASRLCMFQYYKKRPPAICHCPQSQLYIQEPMTVSDLSMHKAQHTGRCSHMMAGIGPASEPM